MGGRGKPPWRQLRPPPPAPEGLSCPPSSRLSPSWPSRSTTRSRSYSSSSRFHREIPATAETPLVRELPALPVSPRLRGIRDYIFGFGVWGLGIRDQGLGFGGLLARSIGMREQGSGSKVGFMVGLGLTRSKSFGQLLDPQIRPT